MLTFFFIFISIVLLIKIFISVSKKKRPHDHYARISIPDRGANEDDITDNQYRYIRRLAPDMPEDVLQTLGKWQASEVIDQIIAAKEDYHHGSDD